MPGTDNHIVHIVRFNFTKIYYYPNFVDEETEAQAY